MTSLLTFSLLHCMKQIDSVWPCVCSVIDHRRRQNVVRTSATRTPNGSCATFLFLAHFEVICDLLLNRRTATWNLFVMQFVQSCHRPITIGMRSFNDQKLNSQWLLVVGTRSVETTIVRTQNMQICHPLRCKQIDMSTADQLTATFRNNAVITRRLNIL